jgi:hypothetical protein
MLPSQWTLIFFVVLIFGCEAKQTTVCDDSQSNDCPTSPTFGGGAISSEVKVTSIKPLVAKPGQEIVVGGVNLTSDVKLRIGDQNVPWRSTDGTTATFLMPITPRSGAFKITVGRNGDQPGVIEAAARFMLSDSSDDAVPIYMAKPEDICAPNAFRDGDGVLQIGVKNCDGTALPDCSGDGQTGCVANMDYPSATAAGLQAKIIAGNTVAGVNGSVTLPPVGLVYIGTAFGVGGTGSVGTLTVPAPSNVIATAPYYGNPDSPLTPSLPDKGTWNLENPFPGAGYYLGVTNIPSPSTIVSGTLVAGQPGSVTAESHSNCTSDGATNCVTTSAFKSADSSLVTAGNIKSGVTIAGQTGDYPSVSFPLPGADTTPDLDTATFDAKVKSAANFEYWNAYGTRQIGSGDANITAANIKNTVSIFGLAGTYSGPAIDAWDLRAGTTVGSVTGKLKVNCRNAIMSDRYNYDGTIASISSSAVVTGASLDPWDTIDDANGTNLGFVTLFPTANLPRPWTIDHFCGGVEQTVGDDKVWKDVTTTGDGVTASSCATTTAHCTLKDKISGLHWSKNQSSVNQKSWMQALNICDQLNHNGFSDWRLPTQKELMDAYVHGIRSATQTNWFTDSEMQNSVLSASSSSYNGSEYLYVNLRNGGTGSYAKSTGLHMVFCVR